MRAQHRMSVYGLPKASIPRRWRLGSQRQYWIMEKVLPPMDAYKALYDNDVVGEGVIIAWHATPPPPGLAALRLAVAPLVTWLQEAEEESD